MYLVEKDLQRATVAGRVSGCPAACTCSVHMYNMQGTPRTSSYAPIPSSPGDRRHLRTKGIQH